MSLTIPIFPAKIFPDKQLQGHYCLSPFVNIHITLKGEVYLCPCPAWGNTRIGNILDSTLDEMLSSPVAQSIRQTIIDGTYSYCNELDCALIINNGLNTIDTVPSNVAWQLEDSSRYAMPYEIIFNGDVTCNLSCPSCRSEVIRVKDEDVARQEAIGQLVYQNIFSKPTDLPIHLTTSGSGEVFASPMLKSFLNRISLSDFPNLALSLHTNGLLAQQYWNRIEHLESSIDSITVSVDAAQAKTYEQVRRGGRWPNILEALKFLQLKKQELGFNFNTRLIVQQANYKEVVDFYDLSKSYGVDRVEYSRLTNWGTWTADEFAQQDVLGAAHPNRAEALELVSQIRSRPDVWFEGNFS